MNIGNTISARSSKPQKPFFFLKILIFLDFLISQVGLFHFIIEEKKECPKKSSQVSKGILSQHLVL